MGGSSIFWLVVIVIAVVVEACTVQLVSVWMAIGGVGALIAGLCGAPFWVQTAVFAGVTALALFDQPPHGQKGDALSKGGHKCRTLHRENWHCHSADR